MSSDPIKIQAVNVGRHVWETGQTNAAVAAGIRVDTRYIQTVLAKRGTVTVSFANQVTSFAEGFTLPFNEDQVPMVRLSRKHICKTETLDEIQEHIDWLTWELTRAKNSSDVEVEAMMCWQITYAQHRAAAFAGKSEANRCLLTALSYANQMLVLLPKTKFKDPALMGVVALRNAATSAYLATVAENKVPSNKEIAGYIAAYDEAEKEIAKSLPSIKGTEERKKALLPMYRALCLDRVELAAYLDDPVVIERAINRLREVGDSKSGLAFQAALDSIPAPAQETLWHYKSWISLLK